MIQPAPPRPIDVNSHFFRGDQTCAYHSNSVGHDAEDCLSLKHKIQDLIDRDMVILRTVNSNVNKNPLPEHGEGMDGMIEREEDWYIAKKIVPDNTIGLEKSVASLSITEKPKVEILIPCEVIPNKKIEIAIVGAKKLIQKETRKTQRRVSETEAEEFWRRMQPQEYAIIKHLEKVPAQISVWAILMNSQHHRQALIRALENTYVPMGTDSDNLAAMISRVTQGHRISFGDEELPFE